MFKNGNGFDFKVGIDEKTGKKIVRFYNENGDYINKCYIQKANNGSEWFPIINPYLSNKQFKDKSELNLGSNNLRIGVQAVLDGYADIIANIVARTDKKEILMEGPIKFVDEIFGRTIREANIERLRNITFKYGIGLLDLKLPYGSSSIVSECWRKFAAPSPKEPDKKIYPMTFNTYEEADNYIKIVLEPTVDKFLLSESCEYSTTDTLLTFIKSKSKVENNIITDKEFIIEVVDLMFDKE